MADIWPIDGFLGPYLCLQVKAVTKFANNELCLHLSFITEPNIKLQIRPTRVDVSGIRSPSQSDIM